ncbi:MAG: hydrogen peroxide-inducible genes activator [Hyphomicrobiaceae bacterium]|nr:hydrogen peroxide-inducible genes activator [Hyphomicrobiaceae bacterium]
MINITLKQLRYFDALSRELHFGRAAEACAVTQPALSMQIQELEQNLGISLLERTRTGVQLTPQGIEIARRAARILGDTRDLIDYAKHGEAVLSGALRLGVIPSVAPYLLPPLLPHLRASFPDLELAVRETQTATLLQELADARLDVILLALPVKQADIETAHLFEDRFVLAMPASRDIAGLVRATPELVEQQRLLLLEEGHCLRDQALTYCELQQSRAINTFGASSLSTIVEMVAAGYGITLLPEISLPLETRGRDLKLIRFVEPEPSRSIGLVWRATSPRKDDFVELARIVREAAAALLAQALAIAEPARAAKGKG